MEAVSYTAVREHLAETMDRVCEDHAPVVITRNRHPSVVMLSLEDYAALEETAYLLHVPANARRLLKSIQDLDGGRGASHEMNLDA